jgi:anthranilate phosphoribosyltransferase
VRQYAWTPEDFGLVTLPAARLADLEVADAAESAVAIRAVLGGERGPRRDVVVLNAAATLWAAGKAPHPPAARQLAEETLDSGAAAQTLDRFVACSRR